jgi:tRNA A37 threonylcarbamoyladenosine dehydratase
LAKELTTVQAMRYSRHLMLPQLDIDGQEALLNASVLVVGMGGLGCAAAPYLVASGVGGLILSTAATCSGKYCTARLILATAKCNKPRQVCAS